MYVWVLRALPVRLELLVELLGVVGSGWPGLLPSVVGAPPGWTGVRPNTSRLDWNDAEPAAPCLAVLQSSGRWQEGAVPEEDWRDCGLSAVFLGVLSFSRLGMCFPYLLELYVNVDFLGSRVTLQFRG